MVQVEITQQNVKARLDIKDPFMRLKTTDLSMQISSEPLSIQMESPAAEVFIDNYPSNYARGFKNNKDFDRDNARKGMEALQNWAGKIAHEGAMLARIEDHGKPLAALASQAIRGKDSDVNIAYVPSPTIKVVTHDVKTQVQQGKLHIRFNNGTATGQLERGTVGLTMLQYPEVHFRVTNQSNRVNIEA
ncbi:MAG: DUF6470 family protein [Sporomusaceae bacterium]|nr:DUF6470 family protein [Sporomusaceae bacterium]